ncbi:uncharacterized protein BO80DRAFT_116595 [Aspergillus ibericus CBS 121593]|uniref:Uncharacterized protein n=1 Tax=Aspergillus ibericus CBS 121593 TaxID=1448316 RepID=A0A395GW96_9EURO|nr:hypothetical protein BO80DRAFT_116595 [Aspergillus ibericus CBS 121593]RAK99816.1 hypothetical protein BO80DRAFT_116595 [Aspergillus ibericus CBS 121593]
MSRMSVPCRIARSCCGHESDDPSFPFRGEWTIDRTRGTRRLEAKRTGCGNHRRRVETVNDSGSGKGGSVKRGTEETIEFFAFGVLFFSIYLMRKKIKQNQFSRLVGWPRSTATTILSEKLVEYKGGESEMED